MTSKEETILKAFYDKQSGLTTNLKKLKSQNPDLQDQSIEDIKTVLMENSEEFQRNQKVKGVELFRSYHADSVGQLIHMDLMFLSSPRNTNQQLLIKDGEIKFSYLLLAVDTHSRYLMCYLTKTKRASEVCVGVESIIDAFRAIYYEGYDGFPFTVLTDGGGEFNSKLIEKIPNTKHVISKNKYGAVIAENYIYKIRDKLRYLKKDYNTVILKSDLEDIILNINKSVNTSISNRYSPHDILFKTAEPEKELAKLEPYQEPKIIVGSYVRLMNYYEKFDRIFVKKSAYNNYSEKVFSIYKITEDSIQNVFQYSICSIDGHFVLDRSFYDNELLAVPVNFVKNMPDSERDLHEEFTKEEIKIYKIRKARKEDFKDE